MRYFRKVLYSTLIAGLIVIALCTQQIHVEDRQIVYGRLLMHVHRHLSYIVEIKEKVYENAQT